MTIKRFCKRVTAVNKLNNVNAAYDFELVDYYEHLVFKHFKVSITSHDYDTSFFFNDAISLLTKGCSHYCIGVNKSHLSINISFRK